MIIKHSFDFTPSIFIPLHLKLALLLHYHSTIQFLDLLERLRYLHFANQLRQIFAFNQMDSNGGCYLET